MADDITPARPTDYGYGQFRRLPSTTGITHHPDTFIGPRDKVYADFSTRDRIRLRGVDGFYLVKTDHPNRVDGDHPGSITDAAKEDIRLRRDHAGLALYGEQVIVGERLDSVRREIEPDWAYANPILVRGLPYEVQNEKSAGDRGGTYVRQLKFDLSRASCDEEWSIRPQPGDVCRIPNLYDGYFDVKNVDEDRSRWGATGFFTVYVLDLFRSTRYEPQRKLPPKVQTTEKELTDQERDS